MITVMVSGALVAGVMLFRGQRRTRRHGIILGLAYLASITVAVRLTRPAPRRSDRFNAKVRTA